MYKHCLRLLAAALLFSCASAQASELNDNLTIATHIMANRCPEAIALLNRGLADKSRASYLLAADMYEKGNCLHADWEKSAQLYQQAYQAGAQVALPRLVGIYALHGRDPAAALWWAAQRPQLLPPSCVPAASPTKTPQAFVEELRTWPAKQLAACTYVAGVSYRLWSEAAFNAVVMANSYTASIDMHFRPAQGRIDWADTDEKESTQSRLTVGGLNADESNRPKDNAFMERLWWLGVKTMQEYGKAPEMDPAWSVQAKFDIERRLRGSSVPIEIGVRQ